LNPILTTALSAANELGVAKNVRPNAKSKVKTTMKLLFMMCPPSNFMRLTFIDTKVFSLRFLQPAKKPVGIWNFPIFE
jgi:hypothetical protein